jgi:predicted PhzF superfamily epimerase YddE/YHI9
LVLARAQSLEEGADLSLPKTARRQNGNATVMRDKDGDGETVRFRLFTEEGEIPLVNYSALGKKWDEEGNRMTVWMDLK